jgi:hypothetical protein
MAAGLVALGEDRVSATSSLGIAVVDAAIEPRRDQSLDSTEVQGDRLWVATGSEVRAYDLATRSLAGTLTLPDAVALAYDRSGHALYVGTRSGEIRIVDVGEIDATRRGPPIQVESRAYMSVNGPIDHMFASRSGDRLVAVLTAGFGVDDPDSSQIVVIDATAAIELGRPALRGVGQVTIGVSDDRIAVATSDGLAFIEPVAATIDSTLDLGGPVMGVVGINDIENDPIFATTLTADGPRVAIIRAKTGEAPRIDTSADGTDQGFLVLPDATAGRVYYDLATRMVHIEGTRRDPGGQPQPTIYVLEPHGNAIYADAPLGFVPVVMVVDENQQYPSTDREELLAFDAGGNVASVPVGRHAYAWRAPGVLAGVLMALFLYVLARLLFKRRTVAVLLALIVMADGMLFTQSRIGMNDSYVGLGIIAAYTIFAALWLRPGDSRRHWLAFALGVPLIGFFLGFALASKWVAAYAIGGLGILALVRSALGRLVLIGGLIFATTALGYVAISVANGSSGGNYLFFLIMVALVVIAVLANTIHPSPWTTEEQWFAVGAPSAAGALAVLYGLSRGDATVAISIGPLSVTPIQLDWPGLLVGAVVYATFNLVGRFGFGPMALPPLPDDPASVLDPPADAPVGWLRIGAGWGLPAIWLVVGLLVIPLGLYVASYIPWAMVEGHQLLAGATAGTGWPPGPHWADAARPHEQHVQLPQQPLLGASGVVAVVGLGLRPQAGLVLRGGLRRPDVSLDLRRRQPRRLVALHSGDGLRRVAGVPPAQRRAGTHCDRLCLPVAVLGPHRPRRVPVPLLHGAAVPVPRPRLLPARAVARDLAPDLAPGPALGGAMVLGRSGCGSSIGRCARSPGSTRSSPTRRPARRSSRT